MVLVEHDEQTAGSLVGALDMNGYRTILCRNVFTARASLAKAGLVLLNIGLAESDALALLVELRASSSVPVLAYSTSKDEMSVIHALTCGADDFMVLPIRPRELLARLKAISRRMAIGCPADQIVQVGDLVIRLHSRTIEVGGKPVALTTKEFDVLAALARSAGIAVSRGEIMSRVWGASSLSVSRTLDVHMTALRGKLQRPDLLVTVRGFGYRLEVTAP